MLLSVLLVLAAAVVVVVAPSAEDGLPDLREGDPPRVVTNRGPAPGFSLGNLVEGGTPVALEDFRGQPVVLNFWASWCVPCRREMPVLAAAHRRVGDRVGFVGINHQDSRSEAIDLLDETAVTYPSGFDPDGRVARSYGIFGLPSTVFISPGGDIVEQRTGELSREQLDDALNRLFRVDVGKNPG